MEASNQTDSSELMLNTALVRDILTRFIRDETQSAGFRRGVVGLSGGVDSAVSATLAAEALGRDNVTAVLMPHKQSHRSSLEDARKVVDFLRIQSEIVDITGMTEAYCGKYGVEGRNRQGNVMARMRMVVLYDVSARENALVIGTSNKSEILTGYGTIFGDLASAINPLGDLYKSQVWQLAEALNLPPSIVHKKPSADLWEGQTDEADLGVSYRKLDSLLYRMVDERRTDDELHGLGFESTIIKRIRTMIRKNQYKRRPPVIAKVSYRTVNVDFRYVRDWGT